MIADDSLEFVKKDIKNFNILLLSTNKNIRELSKQQKIFKISHKINGKLAFSSDKVITKSDLVESFESRIQFKGRC